MDQLYKYPAVASLRRASAGREVESGTPTDGAITVLYIDHRALTRDCIASQLATLLPEFSFESYSSPSEITGACSFPPPGCVICHTHSRGVDSPRIVEELALLREIFDRVPIIILSNLERVENVVVAIHHGVSGYIPTSLPLRAASEAIRLVCAGCSVFPGSALSRTHVPATRVETFFTPASDAVHLTRRQIEVLGELWEGKQNKTIAYELRISEGTVKVHLKHIMKKLHVRNRTQVVLIAQRILSDARAKQST